MTSTSMLLSTYFGDEIDPIEIYNKASENKLIDCGEPINKDNFFYMISNEYSAINKKIAEKIFKTVYFHSINESLFVIL